MSKNMRKKKFLSILLGFVFLLGTFAVSACGKKQEESGTDVYLILGQSNAVGCTPIAGCDETYTTGFDNIKLWQDGHQSTSNPTTVNQWLNVKAGLGVDPQSCGIELGFSEVLSPVYGERECRIIRYSWGGKNLYRDFTPPSALAEGDTSRGHYYREAVKTITQAIVNLEESGLKPRVRAILWMQGEADATKIEYAAVYKNYLKALIRDLRALVGDAWFIIGEIASNCPHTVELAPMVQEAQASVAAEMDRAFLIQTDDLLLDLDCDEWHWQLPEMLTLGRRFGEVVKQLVLNKGSVASLG